MLAKKTVFILGAGASVDLGLPTGDGLKPLIIEVLAREVKDPWRSFKSDDVQKAVNSYLEELPAPEREAALTKMIDAATAIERALPFAFSIDQFLDSRRDQQEVVRMGKIGIAAAILRAEQRSNLGGVLQAKPMLRTAEKGDAMASWHMKLVQLIVSGKSRDEIANALKDISFIVFNYDRCLEQYLFRAFFNYYGDGNDNLDDILRNIHIIHPYGQVGYLAWQDQIPTIGYGEEGGELRQIAEQILTFTESGQCGVTTEVRELIQSAQTVVIMGFGFLPQNVELLTAQEPSDVQRVFYTTKGFSNTDSILIDEDIEKIFGKSARQAVPDAWGSQNSFDSYEETGVCSDLMSHHWVRLTRAAS